MDICIGHDPRTLYTDTTSSVESGLVQKAADVCVWGFIIDLVIFVQVVYITKKWRIRGAKFFNKNNGISF